MRLDRFRQSGSLKLLFPRGSLDRTEAVLLNTAGGLTGGDRMQVEAAAGEAASLTLTTQAAERAYRAPPASEARVATHLVASDGARIDWLPQETILFDGAALSRRMTVEMTGTARVLLVEPLILGRPAMGEVVRQATFRDRWEVRRDGALVYADAPRLQGDLAALLARPGTGGGAGALATVLLAAPEADAMLARVRPLLPATAGASLVRDGILSLRLLAADGYLLRKSLIPVIEALTDTPLPKVWRL